METATAPVRNYVEGHARAQSLKPGDVVMAPLANEPVAFILDVTPDLGFGWVNVTFMDADTHEVVKDRVSVGIKYTIRRWGNR